MPDGAGGPVTIVLADGTGTIFCASLGDGVQKGKKLVASGPVAGGTVSVSIGHGLVIVKGKKLDLGAFDDGNVHVGIAGTDFGAIDAGYANIPAARIGNRLLSRFLVTIDYGQHVIGLWRDPRIALR